MVVSDEAEEEALQGAVDLEAATTGGDAPCSSVEAAPLAKHGVRPSLPPLSNPHRSLPFLHVYISPVPTYSHFCLCKFQFTYASKVFGKKNL
jgi:hypothetical protein